MRPVGGAGAVPETIAVAGAAMLAPAVAAGTAASAISPGMITRDGDSAFGVAAMSGVRRAAAIESAAIARWTTRKSVHQTRTTTRTPDPSTRRTRRHRADWSTRSPCLATNA